MSKVFRAVWRPIRITASTLVRSSHCLQIHDNVALIYGGELKPREPVSADILQVDIASGRLLERDAFQSNPEAGPIARVGASWTAHPTGIYLFSGRGGPDMQPLDPDLWRYDEEDLKWSKVAVQGYVPEGRSYHTAAALGDNLFLHAGCPPQGRLSTLDSFHIPSSTWKSLAQAPGPPRGGTVITAAHIDGKPVLLRFGGFGGPTFGELNDLAVYDFGSDAWFVVEPQSSGPWPEARSVHGFIGLPPTKNGSQEAVAVLFMGEGKPAPAHLGHSGAGNFLSDVWVLSHSSAGFTWTLAKASSAEVPQGRGWFASDLYPGASEHGWKVVLSGGLNETNERLGDVWVLELDEDE